MKVSADDRFLFSFSDGKILNGLSLKGGTGNRGTGNGESGNIGEYLKGGISGNL